MWRNIIPLEDKTLREFETQFKFKIDPVLRGFLMDHNAGSPIPGVFPTTVKERKLVQFLDFSDKVTPKGAWAVNRRLRQMIGEKRIVIGIDSKNNFVCLERNYQDQYITVWSHISGAFEKSLLDIPAFVRCLN